MGFFDKLAGAVGNAAGNAANQAVSGAVNSAVNNAVNNVVNNAGNKSEKFTFSSVPETVEQLMTLPQASLDTPFKTTALTMLVLLRYETDPETCFAMLDALRGPDAMTDAAKSFIKERLNGKTYKVKSFFAGATVQNNYTPAQPLAITVSTNPYSFPEENWATMFITSAGADSPRQIKLRRKPSTNQWFLNDIQCLSDIREPAASDPWA